MPPAPNRRWFRFWLWSLLAMATVTGMRLVASAEIDDKCESVRLDWNKYLFEKCLAAATEADVRKVMDGRYREIAHCRANSDSYRLLYLLDDYHQVEFFFQNSGRLMMTPRVERRGRWLRFPDGNIVSQPEAAEAARKSKIEELAIAFVSKQHGYPLNHLRGHGMRGDRAHTWIATVTLNSLQVDTPSIVVEVDEQDRVRPRP